MTVVDPHLDARAMSAAVDGEADQATADHLAECPLCREELATWRRRLAVLSTPPPLSPPVADAAVAAAMAEWSAPAPAPARPARRRSRRRSWLVPLGVAAALAALVAFVAGLVATGRSGPQTSAAGSAAAPKHASAGTGGTAAGGSRAPSSAGAPDLGKVGGAAVLTADLRTAARRHAPLAGDVPCRSHAATRADLPGATPLYAALLRYEGHGGEVFLFHARGGYLGLVLTPGCALVSTVEF